MNNQEGKIYYGLGLDNKQLQEDADRSMAIIRGIGDSSVSEGARIDNAYKKIAGTVAAVFTIQKAAEFAKSIVQVRGEIEALEISFESLLGSKERADALFGEVRSFAAGAGAPMGLTSLAKGAQMLLGFNVEAEKIMPVLRQIGDISMGSADRFNSLVLAFSQMYSTGKLMGQDLLQMINAGFNPLSVIAEKTGKSISVLKDEMSAGAITVDMVADAFATAASEGGKFYGMLEKQSKGINGSISVLKGTIDDMFNDLGAKNQGVITTAIGGATTLVKHYETIGEALAVIVATYGTYKAAIIATEAVRQSVNAVRYTEEAAQLTQLLTVEQQARISKLGLTQGSAQYAATVKAEVAANVQAAQSTLAKARTEVSAANQVVAARRAEYIAAKQLDQQRLAELMSIGATGTAKQVEAAQRRLAAAEAQKESAALAYQTATRDFNSKKIAVETAAKRANTITTAANTASQKANVTATNTLTAAKIRLTAIAAKLNAVIMANPYMLAAAAVTALGYGIYKLVTYQTEAEKAQSRLNDAIKEAEKSSLGETRELSRLKGELSAAAKGSDEYNRIKEKIVSNYGKYHKGLAEEIEKVGLLDATYKKLTESIQASFAARQYDKFKQSESDNLDEVMSENLGKIQDRLISKLGDEAGSKYYAKIREAILNRAVSIDAGSIATGLDPETQAALDKISGKADNNFFQNYAIEGYIRKITVAQELTDDLDKKARIKFGINPSTDKGSKDQESPQKYGEAYRAAKKEWEAAKKALLEIEKDKDNFTKEQYENAKKREETTKKAYADLSSVISATKAESEYQKRIEAEQKYKLTLSRYELENVRVLEDLEMQVAQARINAMDEGSEKTIAQLELNHKKEIQTIDRQKEDYLRKKIDDARSVFDANPANKGKTFDSSNMSLSDSETKYFDNLYQSIALAQSKSVDDLLEKYQDYAAERLAIEKKYSDDIEVLHNRRNKAEKDGNAALVKELDSAIAQATLNKGKDLISFDFSKLKESPEYVRAFEDLKNTSSETLNVLLEQLDSMKGKAAEVLNPTELREYTSTIQDIINELIERDPFKALSSSQEQLSKSEKELAAAEKTLSQVRKGAKIITKTEIDQNGKIVETFLSEEEAINKVNEARDKYIKSSNNVVKAQRAVKEKTDELYSALSDIGNALGGTAGEIISFIADISMFVSTSIEGMESASKASSASLQAVEKASVILAIISAVIQLMQKLNSLIPSAYDEYLQYAEKIAEINKLKDAVNQYEIAVLKAKQAEESWFATDNLNSLKQAREQNEKVLRAYMDKVEETQAIYKNQSGGGWLTGALNWVMANMSILGWWDEWRDIWGHGSYKEGQTAAKNNLRIETKAKSSGFLGTGIGGNSQETEDLVAWARNRGLGELFDDSGMINKDLAKSLIDNHGNKLVGQTKETLEALIELKEQYDEYLEQLREYVSSLYEPLVDNFVDSLWDWFDEGKDALDSFKSYASDTFRDIVSDMMRTLILEKIVDGFDEDISNLYKEYASGNLTEEQLMEEVAKRTAGLISDYEKNIPTLQGVMENITGSLKDIAGIDLADSIDSSREASSKGFASMSQDSADELNGRFTTIQSHTFEINESLKILAPYSKITSETTLEIRNSMEALRRDSAAILVHLAGIERNTDRLESIESDMKAVKDGINDINLKGITIKR